MANSIDIFPASVLRSLKDYPEHGPTSARYPQARARPAAQTVAGFVRAAAPLLAGEPPPAPVQFGGQYVNSGFITTTGAGTFVAVSERLLGPAVVVQMGCAVNENLGITACRGLIKVSDDDSISGGELTSGDRLSGTNNFRDFLPKTGWDYLYPDLLISRASFFLKFIWVEVGALGVLNVSFIVCLKRV